MPGEVRNSVVAAGFPEDKVPQLLQAMAKGTADALQSVPGFTTVVSAALQAAQKRVYSVSLSTVYLSSLAFGAAALITCFFATNDIDKYFTNFVNKTVSGKGQAENLKDDVEKA